MVEFTTDMIWARSRDASRFLFGSGAPAYLVYLTDFFGSRKSGNLQNVSHRNDLFIVSHRRTESKIDARRG